MENMTDIILHSDYGLPGGQIEKLGEITLEIHNRARQSGENYIEIGNRLIEAKNLLSHGEFKRWLEDATGIQYRTARNMMDAAESFKSETVSLLRPAALIELSKGNVPEGARREAIERASAGENITKRKAKEIAESHAWDASEPNIVKSEPEWIDTDDDWVVPDVKLSKAGVKYALRKLEEYSQSIIELIESDEPSAAWFDERMRPGHLTTIKRESEWLSLHAPHELCPRCEGMRCDACRQSGMVNRRLYKALTEKPEA